MKAPRLAYTISKVLLVIGWTAVLLLLLLFQGLIPAGGTSIYPFFVRSTLWLCMVDLFAVPPLVLFGVICSVRYARRQKSPHAFLITALHIGLLPVWCYAVFTVIGAA